MLETIEVTQTKRRPASRSTTRRRNTGHTARQSNGRTTDTRRIDALGDDLRKAGRRAGRRTVRVYESTWGKVADLEDKVAEKIPVDWVTDVARAQARVTRKVSKAYGLEARKLIG